jgi:vacuolar-type H+-ATPase subunit F/Vma7
MEIAAVGDEYFVIGFQAAGIRNAFVVGEKETFEELMEKDGIGIIITEKKVFDSLDERLKEKAMTQLKPIVVVLSHDIGGEENLRLMIKRSVGIDLWG